MVTWKIPADQLLSLPGPKQLSRRQNRRQSYGSSPRISHSTSPDCTLQLKELELLPGLTEHDFPHFTRFSLASTTHVLQFSYAPGNVFLQCIPELEPFLDHLQTRHGLRKSLCTSQSVLKYCCKYCHWFGSTVVFSSSSFLAFPFSSPSSTKD